MRNIYIYVSLITRTRLDSRNLNEINVQIKLRIHSC